MTANTEPIHKSLIQFATTVYRNVVEGQLGRLERAWLQNTFLSPLSLFLALSMAEAGSAGDTRQELISTIHLPTNLNESDLHMAIGLALSKCLVLSSGMDAKIANRLFVFDEKAEIMPSYNSLLNDNYNATTEKLSGFPDNEAKRCYINRWITNITEYYIQELLPPFSVTADTSATLVNAVYFKSFWKRKFDIQHTTNALFYKLDESTMNIKLMFLEQSLPFMKLESCDAQMVKIPFHDSSWELVIVLPNRKTGLPTVLEYLSRGTNLESMLTTECKEQAVQLFLPRFKVGEGLPLNIKRLLRDMGIKNVFIRGEADLSGICSNLNLFISDVFHKAVLEVDEDGAAASAYTPNYDKCFRPVVLADHPFFIAVVYNRTLPVFLGHVTEPNSR